MPSLRRVQLFADDAGAMPSVVPLIRQASLVRERSELEGVDNAWMAAFREEAAGKWVALMTPDVRASNAFQYANIAYRCTRQPEPIGLDVGLLEGLWASYKSPALGSDAMDAVGMTTAWRHFRLAFEHTFAPVPTTASVALIDALNAHSQAGMR
jgi:hypothetical protein